MADKSDEGKARASRSSASSKTVYPRADQVHAEAAQKARARPSGWVEANSAILYFALSSSGSGPDEMIFL